MEKKGILLITLLALMGIALTACNRIARGSAMEDSAVLENTPWVLESYGEQDRLQPVLEDTEITAEFNSAEGEIKGSAGCNNYFASYEVNGNKLSVSAIGRTEMFCVEPEGVMEREEQYLSALAAADSYQVQDGQLHIFCSGGQVLIFSTR